LLFPLDVGSKRISIPLNMEKIVLMTN